MTSKFYQQTLALLFTAIVFSSCCRAGAVRLDIHLSLRNVRNDTTDQCPYQVALESNLRLRQLSVKEEIDFFTLHTPHVTLYQTEFDIDDDTAVNEFVNAAAAAIMSNRTISRPCHIQWPSSTSVSTDFAMYFISNTPCLQRLSNHIVDALNVHIHRPPPIPEWVRALPPLDRKRALTLIHRYGSPNVLERFQPHVTVGYDTVYPPFRRERALKSLVTPRNCQGNLAVVSIANVGVGGSVLQNGVIGTIPLAHSEML